MRCLYCPRPIIRGRSVLVKHPRTGRVSARAHRECAHRHQAAQDRKAKGAA